MVRAGPTTLPSRDPMWAACSLREGSSLSSGHMGVLAGCGGRAGMQAPGPARHTLLLALTGLGTQVPQNKEAYSCAPVHSHLCWPCLELPPLLGAHPVWGIASCKAAVWAQPSCTCFPAGGASNLFVPSCPSVTQTWHPPLRAGPGSATQCPSAPQFLSQCSLLWEEGG